MAELETGRGGTRAWGRIRQRIMRRDGGVCVQCGSPGTQVDHVLPRWAGGEDEWNNLQTLCGPCHKRKSAREARIRLESGVYGQKQPKTDQKGSETAENEPKTLRGGGKSPFQAQKGATRTS